MVGGGTEVEGADSMGSCFELSFAAVVATEVELVDAVVVVETSTGPAKVVVVATVGEVVAGNGSVALGSSLSDSI